MVEQRRGADRAREGDQVRHDVVDRSNEAPIDDVGAGHHESARERDREQELHHGPQFPLRAKRQLRLAVTAFLGNRSREVCFAPPGLLAVGVRNIAATVEETGGVRRCTSQSSTSR